jgi:hypothetical protein
MEGFAVRISFFDIFDRLVPGLILILNLVLITFPSSSLKEIYSYLPSENQFLTLLMIITLSYIFGIALPAIGVLLGHLLLGADIEHAIDWYLREITINPGREQGASAYDGDDKQESSQKKILMILLEKNFGQNLSLRSYLDLARAKLKETCPNATYEIDRQNATSMMMRGLATAQFLAFAIALVILILQKPSDNLVYFVIIICSIILTSAFAYQSRKVQRWWVRQVFETFYAMNYTSAL